MMVDENLLLAVCARIRHEHAACDPAGCGLRLVTLEDVQEIFRIIDEEKAR